MQVKRNARNNLQLLSDAQLVWSVSSKQLTSLRQTQLEDRVQQCMLVCHMVEDRPPSTQGQMKDEDFPTCVRERCVSDLHTPERQEI